MSGGTGRRTRGAAGWRAPVAAAALLALAATGLAGCGRAAAGNDALPATLRTPTSTANVIDGTSPQQLSVGMTRALFTSAPVVVATTGGPATITRAAKRARRIGAPLLVGAPTGRASALTAEIRRLKPRDVLTVGRHAARILRKAKLSDTGVVTDPTKLPKVSRPHAQSVAVLVHADGDAPTRAGAAAVGAIAHAAGAQVVAVHGDDPRADRDAITALHKRPPRRILAAGTDFGPTDRFADRVTVATSADQLPGGGQVMFPGRRLVAMYGHPGEAVLGVLGEQGLDASIARARRLAAQYDSRSDVPVIPTFEIIATVATGAAGPDGDYSYESSLDEIEPWVRKAGEAGMYVVLDLQPGRANLLDQAKLYKKLLRLPYVGLALDPEWHLERGQHPLAQIGGVESSEINKVSAWLADLTASAHLPQKLLVLHQFQLQMIRHEKNLDLSHDDLSILIHMDGQGSPSLKDGTWGRITKVAPDGVWWGWKNFYDEDHPMLTPAQTMTKRPTPVMISYQ